MRWCSDIFEILCFNGSQLVINQVNGIWKVKSPAILPPCHEAKGLLSEFDDITSNGFRGTRIPLLMSCRKRLSCSI